MVKILAAAMCVFAIAAQVACKATSETQLKDGVTYKETNTDTGPIPEGCHQFMHCRSYKVLSFDAQWRNAEGNEGLFALRSGNRIVDGFCGARPGSCWRLVDKVGQVVWMDDDDLSAGLLRYDPLDRKASKQQVTLVVTKITANE